MNRRHGAAIVVALVVAALVLVLVSSDGEPSGQPSSAPSPAATTSTPLPTATSSSVPTATSSLPPSPSASSVPTATATTPAPTPSSQVTAVPVRTPPGGITDGGSGASDLRSLGFCDPDSPATAAMALSWRSANSGEQLVAISTRPDGFETGRYTVSENLPAAQEQYTISPVEPGGVYYWRVLTRSGQGWVASKVATFTGPTCVVDSP